MKFNMLIIASILMIPMHLEATRKNDKSNLSAFNSFGQLQSNKKSVSQTATAHEEAPAIHGIDHCIIAAGIFCCLPCIAIEQCYKKLFPRFKTS